MSEALLEHGRSADPVRWARRCRLRDPGVGRLIRELDAAAAFLGRRALEVPAHNRAEAIDALESLLAVGLRWAEAAGIDRDTYMQEDIAALARR